MASRRCCSRVMDSNYRCAQAQALRAGDKPGDIDGQVKVTRGLARDTRGLDEDMGAPGRAPHVPS